MNNHYKTRHPRGSAPQPTEIEQESREGEKDTATEHPGSIRSRRAKNVLPATEPHPKAPPDGADRWQDDGGESGED